MSSLRHAAMETFVRADREASRLVRAMSQPGQQSFDVTLGGKANSFGFSTDFDTELKAVGGASVGDLQREVALLRALVAVLANTILPGSP